MRLIDTKDLSVCEFQGSQIPDYAILSHRWEDEEITLKELLEGGHPEKKGWAKLRSFQHFAFDRGHRYVWLDTCCIDKSSSAELSEAINSMFRWYREATVCYAYMCDVPSRTDYMGPESDWSETFRESVIWSRGWTLQELLAPREVVFISSDWGEVVGTKASLSTDVSVATAIPEAMLSSYHGSTLATPTYLGAATVAEVMSWASKRLCTRTEDSAYSLMSLFGISMPLLYGEGGNAFLRLQLEIITRTDDESIFAWRGFDLGCSSLAASLSNFQICMNKPIRLTDWDPQRKPYAMTNKGLRFEALLCRDEHREYGRTNEWLMPLNVSSSASAQGLAVLLVFHDDGITAKRYYGKSLIEHNYSSDDERFERRTIFIRQSWHL